MLEIGKIDKKTEIVVFENMRKSNFKIIKHYYGNLKINLFLLLIAMNFPQDIVASSQKTIRLFQMF